MEPKGSQELDITADILNQKSPVYITFYSIYILKLSFHLHLGLPSGIFPLCLQTIIL